MSETFLCKLPSFHTEVVSAKLLWGNVLLRGGHPKYAKNSHFENFESALYLTLVSVHLIGYFVTALHLFLNEYFLKIDGKFLLLMENSCLL